MVANSTRTAAVHAEKFFLMPCYEYYSMDGYPFNELADMDLICVIMQMAMVRELSVCQEMFPH
jgi:hypothetical protein